MSAPDSVVRAVMEEMRRHEETDNLDGTSGCICSAGPFSGWQQWRDHYVRSQADAAWAAALPYIACRVDDAAQAGKDPLRHLWQMADRLAEEPQ